MSYNIDRYMSRLNDRLMSSAQQALNDIGYTLDEMEMAAENAPERDDIKACIKEAKAKTKKALTEAWATANHWSEHFDCLCGGEEADDGEKGEPSEDTDSDKDEE